MRSKAARGESAIAQTATAQAVPVQLELELWPRARNRTARRAELAKAEKWLRDGVRDYPDIFGYAPTVDEVLDWASETVMKAITREQAGRIIREELGSAHTG